MMNNRLTSYQLQDFAEEDDNSVFSDPDYVVASPLLLFPDEEESIKVNFLMMLFCLDGNLCLNFDDRKIELLAGDLLLVPPNVIVHSIRKSERCLITMVGYSLSAVRRLLTSNRDAWIMFNALNQKPLISYNQKIIHNFISTFVNILRFRSNRHDHYCNELKESLMASIFFYVINDIHVPAYDNVITTQHRHSADRIFLEFSNALAVDNGCHRTVAYYADKQCVSPKYLSKIVKQYTGKPAIGIILEHAVDKIRAELKYTDIPIKEVAERFGFDDYASFCKFVKTHIGCSPQNCRNS